MIQLWVGLVRVFPPGAVVYIGRHILHNLLPNMLLNHDCNKDQKWRETGVLRAGAVRAHDGFSLGGKGGPRWRRPFRWALESERNLRRWQEGVASWEIILGRRKGDQGYVMARGRELCSAWREARYREGRKGGGQWWRVKMGHCSGIRSDQL